MVQSASLVRQFAEATINCFTKCRATSSPDW